MVPWADVDPVRMTGLRLVNLGFRISRFSYLRFSGFVLLSQHVFEKYVGEISRNK